MTVGQRNKNPLNVKQPLPERWLDAGNKDSGTDGVNHAIFSEWAYGVRAGIINLRSYFFNKSGSDIPRTTIALILAKWAPASDTLGSLPGGPRNSPKAYSLFVSGRMGIDPNKRLNIFDPDRSLGDIAQLRALFYSMAAYENGAEIIPDGAFEAGLELLEPGITRHGTESTFDTTTIDGNAADVAKAWEINRSVGAMGDNEDSDVTTVQQMLRNVAMILEDPRIDPGEIDGEVGDDPAVSRTVRAIVAFQARFMVRPDGLIEVGGRTWRELAGVLAAGPQTSPEVAAPGTGGFFFPLAKVPATDWETAPRSYGARRDGGKRAHAGCDLYAPAGTIIYAVADGTVIRGPKEFYAKTFLLEIDHGDFVVRYGEVEANTMVEAGDKVRAGQPIARVGHLQGISVPSDMLHFELYSKKATGPLTVGALESGQIDGRPTMRRKDLIDPTEKLKEWAKNLPGKIIEVLVPASAPTPTPTGPSGVPASIPATGFAIVLERERQEKRAGHSVSRTVGEYTCYWYGSEIPGLNGHIVEREGKGDNTEEIGNNRDRRIREGTYRLSVHYGGNYRTIGYNNNAAHGESRRPGILLMDTGERTWILIHPGKGYFSSVGCLNPSKPLSNAASNIDYEDSRDRTIAVIEAMRKHLGAKFPTSGVIPDAVIVIKGEPV